MRDDYQDYIEWLRKTCRRRGIDDKHYQAMRDYASTLLKSDLPVVYDGIHLALHLKIRQSILWSFVHEERLHYREFRIPKTAGGMRRILAPKPTLKHCQRWILHAILDRIPVDSHATGFRAGFSIADNARPHVNQEVVVSMDIEDFFPSIAEPQVFRFFRDLHYTRRVSYLLTELCTFSDVLPQGAPTSPALANLICKTLDRRLSGLAMAAGGNVAYTRYADDITFSGPESTCRLTPKIQEIVEDEGFRMNRRKTRVMHAGQAQIVTGLAVNTKVSIPKKIRRKLQQMIYYCEKYGAQNHRRYVAHDRSNLRDHLYGWAYYIMGFHREEGQKLLDQLDRVDW